MNFKDDYNGRKNGKDKNRIVYKKGFFLKSFMGGGGVAVDFHFTTSYVTWLILYASWYRNCLINGFTEPLVGCGKGPGFEVVIMGRCHLSRDQMCMSYFRQGMPWARASLNPESSKWWTKKVAGQMLRRGPIHSRDFVFVKPPRSVTWRNQYGPEGDY